jgi:hypothetical protein
MLAALRAALVCAAVVAVGTAAIFIAPDVGSFVPVFLSLSVLYLFAGVLIHELGHVVAALAGRWRVHQIVVGSIGFAPRALKWTLERRTAGGSSDLGGWVLATPRPSNVNRSGEIMFLLGGSLANLLSTLLCLAVASFLRDPIAAALVLGFSAVSLVLGLVNLIPWRGRGETKSDGELLKQVTQRKQQGLKPGPLMEIEMRVYGDLLDKLPPRPSDVAELRRIPVEEIPLAGRIDTLKVIAISSGDLVWTRRLILEAERRGSPLTLYDLTSLALTAALVDNNETSARAYLDRVPAELRQTDISYLRALAAVEHVGGRTVEAKRAVAAVRHLGGKEWGDNDDRALFQAIEAGLPLPPLGLGVK